MSSPDWFVIARREFLERVRTVWFVVVTILGPVGMIAALVVPAILAQSTANQGVRAAIVDRTGKVAPSLAASLTELGWQVDVPPADTPDEVLLARIRAEELDGFVVVPADALEGGKVIYSGGNATNQGAMSELMQRVHGSVLLARASDAGLSAEQVTAVLRPVEFEPRLTTGEASSTSGMASFIVGYAVMFVLYMAILLYAVNVLRSVVQEKTNRVVEIMVAAAKPRALMLGKILGVGAVGLLQLVLWAIMAFLLMRYRGAVLGVFGIASAGDWSIPPLGIVDVAVILGYFLLGYFFFAALYAAIGSMVNSDQEAQQVQTPVVLLLVIPVACVQLVANDPRGTVAEALTLIPFSAPVLMPLRYLLGGATTLDVLLSLGILAVSTYLVALVAARIYRVGILMYGKRPSLRELVRWLRY